MNKVHERHIRTRISGTCEWIQSNQTFSEWKSTPSTTASETMLCIFGVHGSGKSVLSSAIFERLKAEGHNVVLFSFSATDVDRQTANSVARFLLSHLLSRGSRESVDGIYTMFSDERHPSTPQLWGLLQDLLLQETQPTFYIFDGLDEASDDQKDIINGMLKVLENCLESKCLFLGRPQAFDKITESEIPRNRRIEMNQTLTQPDIEAFIDTNIKKLDTLQSQGLRAHASEVLKRNCGSMFLWADLMVKDLAHAYSQHDTMEKLGNLPRDLEAAYQQIFSRLQVRLYPNEQLLLRNVLTFVVTARRPLSPLELSWAHALRVSSDLNGETPVHDFLLDNPENRILHVGRDFFSIYDDRVHLNHSSIKDFLTRSHFCEQYHIDTDLKKFHVDLKSSNALLAKLCLDYLEMEDHGFPIREPDSLDDLRKLHPFMEYASYNFLFHAQSAGLGLSRMADKLKSLFSSTRAISWLDHLIIAWSEAEFDPSFLLTDLTPTGSKDEETTRGLIGILLDQVNRELAFRTREFGEDDTRTEHLRASVPTLNFVMGSPLDLEDFWDRRCIDTERASRDASTSSASHQQDTVAVADVIRILQSAQAINSQRQVSIILGMLSQMRRNFLDPLHMLYRLFLSRALSLPVYAVLGIGVLYFNTGRDEQAFQLCSRILPRIEGSNTHEESWTYCLIGCCLCRLGRHDEAITYLIRGSRKREFDPGMIRDYLGMSFNGAYRFEEGVSTLRSLMAQDKTRYGKTHPCMVDSEYWLGCLLEYQGEHEESFECYCRALQVFIENPKRAYPPLIQTLIEKIRQQFHQSGRYEEAIAWSNENYVDILGRYPKWFQASANCSLGLSYFCASDKDEGLLPHALNCFEKAYSAERECQGKLIPGIIRKNLRSLSKFLSYQDSIEYTNLLRQAWDFHSRGELSDIKQEFECFRKALDHLFRHRISLEEKEKEEHEEV